ncbi:MAG TPA: integrin alpha, partial [Anaerolineae bacterium]|nr:integrin alpha [Anaerolineae bacterium]
MRSKLLSIGVVGIVIGVLLSTAAVFAGSLNPPVAAAAAQAPDVPMDWWAAVQEEIRQSEYDITWQEGTYLPDLPAAYQAPNRAQGLRTYFGPDGPVVVPRVDAAAWRLDLRVAAEGAQPLQVAGNRVQYRYSNLVVEYANTDQGVDQTFTLPAPLGGAEGIALELALDTDLAARLSDDGMAVEFAGASGAAVLRYSLGAATDAQGQPLAARLELAGRSLRLAVAGRQAYSLAVTAQLRSTVPRAVAAAAPEGLSTTAAWTVESDQVEAEFGVAVGTAGDVNGDGYADVIVGAWLYDNGQTDEGRAFVYHGSAAGLSTTAAWTAESDQDYAEFGGSVGTAGDENGDGYADVIVGAWLYSNGQSYEGRAFVYYGNGGDGLDVKAQQRRADDSAPVAPGGQVVNPAGARLAALLRTP